ncbi:MAG: hypothetical protein K0Q80_2219 [Microvirga sp.]|nr:hypothetical protein [Microvirga sp.]
MSCCIATEKPAHTRIPGTKTEALRFWASAQIWQLRLGLPGLASGGSMPGRGVRASHRLRFRLLRARRQMPRTNGPPIARISLCQFCRLLNQNSASASRSTMISIGRRWSASSFARCGLPVRCPKGQDERVTRVLLGACEESFNSNSPRWTGQGVLGHCGVLQPLILGIERIGVFGSDAPF